MGHCAARNKPYLAFLFSAIILCTQSFPVLSTEDRRFATVPALSVLADGQTGTIHYIVLQIEKDPRLAGPTVQFNEIHLGGGSIVSEDWKEGVKQAVVAAAEGSERRRTRVGDHKTGHTIG